MPRLNVVVASTRPGRVGHVVGDWFRDLAVAHGAFDVHVVDLAQLDLPFHDEPGQPVEGGPYVHEHTRRWSETTDAADAFVLVMPEYNRGYSAPLKNALDFLHREWHHKPVAFVSYGMTSAGLRAVEQITPVVVALGMTPVPRAVGIHLRQALDATGALVPTTAMASAADGMLDELRLLADALAPLRAAAAAA
ncbi:NADPH-dependent FMN reductase [Cellulomonas sp. JZ18]|uniref:NADPH-dependent FMN reductase n=1 Tax=Cellulomonas sp. JZ18 TaxID=2654191 RepID=UPI0012D40B36|nr:NAD(P)H-dependent oxidoreductase [Cellulomonas sp. JZ18]QGQ18042.1 NADPH-dependent FMN reductase [Cellulomonas sp. JZ18]